jgi:DNA-binding LacI/PurR family transcriptional regulator
MATRREVDEKRVAMQEQLRQACLTGQWPPGTMLSPVRELATRYGVSRQVVWQSIQNLVEEGVLYSVPRVGTFVGQQRTDLNPFLLTFPRHVLNANYQRQIQIGFEERINQLGGVSLCLVDEEAAELQRQGQLLPLAGIFQAEGQAEHAFRIPGVPTVAFGAYDPTESDLDTVQFDDFGGGVIATQHFVAMGHRKIAFLGLHRDTNQPPALFWSQQREAGWRHALLQAGLSAEGLAFHPNSQDGAPSRSAPSHQTQRAGGYEMAVEHIISRPDITALVAANVIVAGGIFAALGENVNQREWPAVVCFDDLSPASQAVTSYLRLPWDELGRQAAQVLWERKSGQLPDSPQRRTVPMRLVRRLTCYRERSSAHLMPLMPSAAEFAGATV